LILSVTKTFDERPDKLGVTITDTYNIYDEAEEENQTSPKPKTKNGGRYPTKRGYIKEFIISHLKITKKRDGDNLFAEMQQKGIEGGAGIRGNSLLCITLRHDKSAHATGG
jgi:hypothetical protein